MANVKDPLQQNHQLVIPHRKEGYVSARNGKRFAICSQTAGGATFTGQTSFVATTPTFMIYKPTGTALLRHVLSKLRLAQAGTVAANMINILVMLDSANRFSAGGTAIVPKNMNSDFIATAISDVVVLANPTATAAGAGSVNIAQLTEVPLLGVVTELDALDGIIMGPTSSLLIYTWATTTGPTWHLSGEIIEE